MAPHVYLLEAYTPNASAATAEETVRVLQAASELDESTAEIRIIGHVLVPGDELCLYLIEAPDEELVALLAGRAGITFERIAEANATLGPEAWGVERA